MQNFVFWKKLSQTYGKFYPAKTKYVSFLWDHTKDTSLLVAFYNFKTGAYIGVDFNGKAVMKFKDIRQINIFDEDADSCLWEMECVDHNLRASQVAIAVGAPVFDAGSLVLEGVGLEAPALTRAGLTIAIEWAMTAVAADVVSGADFITLGTEIVKKFLDKNSEGAAFALMAIANAAHKYTYGTLNR